MGYRTLGDCVRDLERHGQLLRIDAEIDPYLEMAYVQRRAFRAGSPALLFTRPRGCRFPMLANLFGTKERANFIFRDALERVGAVFTARADIAAAMRKPWRAFGMLPGLWHMRPRRLRSPAPVLEHACRLADIPPLVSWPQDGGPFITLPLVYSEDPDRPGSANLGMYRIQLAGDSYGANEIGLHYQLQRGIGAHHARALARGERLPVNVHVGGPPALALAAVMPLPPGMSELVFAGLLGARRMELAAGRHLPVLAQCDFVIQGRIMPGLRPEGPFGDHLGYYSLRHNFPAIAVEAVSHRSDAIWPFTSVGRPPQEDTVFGDLIHELTAPMVGNVFEGIREVHAVDAAGVHPLLLAIGSERYTPYEAARRPRELLTLAMHLLGTTQTALAKFVLIMAAEDAPGLTCRDVPAFFRHMLERTDFGVDLHFFTRSACDTLDYTGYGLHEGSRLIWTAAGEPVRTLGTELPGLPDLPPGFSEAALVMPGVVAVSGPPHAAGRTDSDQAAAAFAACFEGWRHAGAFPLIVIADDARFCAASLENFLWTVFTRADPARDIYGPGASFRLKHWSCNAPLIIDGRLKGYQAAPLEDDPQVVARVEALAVKGAPLHGII